MTLGLCDRRDRIAARIFAALRTGCPCCTFYRGVALGFAAGAVVAWGAEFVARVIL